MDVKYIVTYNKTTRQITSVTPAGGTYPAEGDIEGDSDHAIVHQTEDISGLLSDFAYMHWIDESNNIVNKGTVPGEHYLWDLETKEWIFQETKFWDMIRRERNHRLFLCDWTQLPDSSLTDEQVQEWQAYRQVLRDLPSQYQSVNSFSAIVWPEPPSGETIEVTVW